MSGFVGWNMGDFSNYLAGAAYIEQASTELGPQWAKMAASIAPVWRVITMRSAIFNVLVAVEGGTSGAATVSGITALAPAGIAIAVAVGVWVSLGSGYYQAREIVKQRATMSGFSQGFATAVLEWRWQTAASRFGMPYVIRTNVWDSGSDRIAALANNEGLARGFALGSSVPADKKKEFRIAMRKLAGRTDNATWSKNDVVARTQQIDYVIALAAAGMKHGLIVPE